MKKRGLVAALLAAGFIGTSALAADTPLAQLLAERPGVRAFEWNGSLSRLYGAPMSTGSDVEDSAWNFLENHAAVFHAELADLVQTPTLDGLAYQPVMYDANTGDFKFFAVYFAQVRDHVSVFDSNLTLVVRNDRAAGYPVVLAVNNLKNLGSYSSPQNVMTPADVRSRQQTKSAISDLDQVIYLDERGGEQPVARLAYTFIRQTGSPGMPIAIGINGEPREGSYDKRRVIVDAQTGAVLYQESLIHSFDDVSGNVTGKATPGLVPDRANNLPVDMPLSNVTVQIIGGNSANTNVLGDFIIPNGGIQQVTVRSRMVGPALLGGVTNQATGGVLLIDQIVTPPGPADFLQNPAPSEFLTSQVNAMLQASKIHSRVLQINPSYPGTGRSFVANVNINDSCNAYYDGPSINFYRKAGGCENTAYTTVVYHEYGHKLVGDAGTNQGAYGEGMGDVMGVVMTENPITGEDFFTNGQDIRDARAGRQYPCSGEIHSCGQVLSGCAYFTQEALRVTEPSEYRNILGDLALNSVLFRPSGITPAITIDWLTLDDNDGDISNGTPHYAEINDGFSRHNMDAPPLALLDFDYPSGRPERLDPAGGTTFRVIVSPINAQPRPGTGMLHYDDGSGWNAISMNEVQSNVYDAVFPAIDCGDTVRYYVSAETTGNETITDPDNAPTSSFSAFSADNIITYLADDFETDMGWTVQNENIQTGAWQRGVPVGGGARQDPATDFDGSGRCFVTDNRPGDSDVDGGPTRLISPTFNMAGSDGIVRYARWFVSINGNTDRFTVDISNDNGSTWTNVENIPSQGEQWIVHEFRVSEFINPTATMKIRFNATDNPSDSVTEAGIDAVNIFALDCGGGGYTLNVTGTCPGSVNVAWSGADSNTQQGIVFGNNLGSTQIPSGPCQGTTLGVSGQVRLVRTIGTGSGSGSINGQANSGACGHYLQLVQGGTCATSNPDQIP